MVEKYWIGQGYGIYYPTIHKEEVLEYIKHLSFYLTKAYGPKIRSEFSYRVQDTVDTTVWNEETGKGVSAKDQQLIDTTESYKSMAWLEFDESVDFRKHIAGKTETIQSESDNSDGI